MTQKELERRNKELEKQISGSGVIVYFAEKLESLPDKARLLVGPLFFLWVMPMTWRALQST